MAARRRHRPPRDAAQRQADQRIAAHRDPGRGRVFESSEAGGQGDGRDDSCEGRSPHLHAARARWSGRRHRALELPAAARGVEGRPGAGLRQHGHSQAGERDAADRPGAGRAGAGGGLSAGCPERRDRRRFDGRPGARRTPRHRQDRVHGRYQHGPGIMRSAAATVKKITLELGGKSPNIVLPDADIEAAIRGATMGIFYGKGEVCAAGSRLLSTAASRRVRRQAGGAREEDDGRGADRPEDALWRDLVAQAARDRARLPRIGKAGRGHARRWGRANRHRDGQGLLPAADRLRRCHRQR